MTALVLDTLTWPQIEREIETGRDTVVLARNGTIGDPSRSSAEHGDRYWASVIDLVLDRVDAGDDPGR